MHPISVSSITVGILIVPADIARISLSPCPALHSPNTLTLQVLYYNFYEHPDVVFDNVVEIMVLNSKNPITKALIGTFKVTALYSSMTHSILACLYSIPSTCLGSIPTALKFIPTSLNSNLTEFYSKLSVFC